MGPNARSKHIEDIVLKKPPQHVPEDVLKDSQRKTVEPVDCEGRYADACASGKSGFLKRTIVDALLLQNTEGLGACSGAKLPMSGN